MRTAAKRTISLLLSLALLIVAVAVYTFFVRPAYDEIILLRGELSSKNQFLQEQKNAIGRVNELILQYRGAGKLQDTISLSLPLAENLSSVFDQLRILASMNGLLVEIFNVKPLALQSLARGPLVKNVGTLELSVRLVGSYGAFKDFLRNLENNIRVMDLQTVRVEHVGAGGSDLFAYNITVNTYYQE